MMVVNAENISRLMDYAWHDVNGHKMKGSSGENTILCYRVSSPNSRLDYSKQRISAEKKILATTIYFGDNFTFAKIQQP